MDCLHSSPNATILLYVLFAGWLPPLLFFLIFFTQYVLVSGIFRHEPQDAPGAKFRCSVSMGKLEGGTRAIDDAVYQLREEFGPNDYNILSRNCNHFSNAFCMALIDQPTPAWVNRVANIGSYFSCLFPPQMLGDAPVNEGGGNYKYLNISSLLLIRGKSFPMLIPLPTLSLTHLGGRQMPAMVQEEDIS